MVQDASQCQCPAQLRQSFAHILIHCEVAEPAKLFATLKDDEWATGFAHHFNIPSDHAKVKDMVLIDIQDKLGRAGKTLEEFNLPLPQDIDVSIMKTET